MSDPELLAILLRCGPRGPAPSEAAESLIQDAGGLAPLLAADQQDLRGMAVSEPRATVLLAIAELCHRWSRERIRRHPLTQPSAVADYLWRRYHRPDQEVIGALFLDPEKRLIAEQETFRGSLADAVVEPRPILREALRHRAVGVLVFHTHPSGNATPSEKDWRFTERLASAGELVGIRLVDHLVVAGPGRWVSMIRLRPW